MSRQSLLRTSLIAALILGSVAGSITTSFAATTGRGGGNGGGGGSSGGGASAGGGGGNGGGTSEEARLVATNPDCRTRVCNPPPRRPPVYVPATFVEPSRCTNVWRKVTLQDGTVVEDRSVALRRHCRVIRPFE